MSDQKQKVIESLKKEGFID
jgi:hypothetical protein